MTKASRSQKRYFKKITELFREFSDDDEIFIPNEVVSESEDELSCISEEYSDVEVGVESESNINAENYLFVAKSGLQWSYMCNPATR